MRIAIMQPYFFPYLGYYQMFNAVDKFVILDDVNYIKRGYINSNSILINGLDCLVFYYNFCHDFACGQLLNIY